MNFYSYFFTALLTTFILACGPSKNVIKPEDITGMQHADLDEINVKADMQDMTDMAEPPPYRVARERKWDLLHTALDLSFDWTRQTVIGSATLKLKPLFYEQNLVALDAIDFDVKSVSLNKRKLTTYENSGEQIIITFPRAYTRDDEIEIEIEYTAFPQPGALNDGAAIRNDQGLFFIDPLDTIPGTGRQLWTQGETSSNRRWFPTLDQPNERATQEITLTVADTLITLSNGVLMSSTPVEGGMRQDYWKLDLPHAPYLTMIAVGQWDKVTDYWRGRPVDYYVKPGYGPDARAIFAHTTEMLEFFSGILDYPFVWPKYAQVIVDQFVSGAMENTTAVTFGDFIEFRKEDVVLEGANDYIVAHELFHHWFGDLVTCESWANIALNEGFANYAEYLWTEHKYGREKADLSRMNELSGYYDQAESGAHPLVYYYYPDEGSVFDAHSYNKGGLVLHMLRDLVGDEAFFAALKIYLDRHEFSAVEVDDLRQAFEELTGRDLNWFFDQWYYGVGHPMLEIQHFYDSLTSQLSINIRQIQDELEYREIFQLPIEVAIYDQDTTMHLEKLFMDSKQQTFTIPVRSEPLAVIIDPRDILLAVVDHAIDSAEYPVRALKAVSVSHRLSALRVMTHMSDEMVSRLMKDPSVMSRAMAIQHLTGLRDTERLYQMALEESDTELRFYLLESLSGLDGSKARNAAVRFLETAKSIPLIHTCLKAIEADDIDEAMHQLAHFQDLDASSVYALRASVFAKKGINLTLDYFTTPRAAGINENYLEELIHAMMLFLSRQPAKVQDKGLSLIDSDFYLKTPDNQYRRFFLITGLFLQHQAEEDGPFKSKIQGTIQRLYEAEPDAYLRSVLKEGLGDLLH